MLLLPIWYNRGMKKRIIHIGRVIGRRGMIVPFIGMISGVLFGLLAALIFGTSLTIPTPLCFPQRVRHQPTSRHRQ